MKVLFLGVPVDDSKLRSIFEEKGLEYPEFEDRSGGLTLKCESCNQDVMIGIWQSATWLHVEGMVLCPLCVVNGLQIDPGFGIVGEG